MPHRPLKLAVLVFLTALDFVLLAIALACGYVTLLGFSIPSSAESDYAFQLTLLLPWIGASGALLLALFRGKRLGLPPAINMAAQVVVPITATALVWWVFARWVPTQAMFFQLPLDESAEAVLSLPGGVIGLFWIYGLLLVGGVRLAGWLTAPRGPAPGEETPTAAVLVGSGPLARKLADDLASLARPGFRISGVVSSDSDRGSSPVAGLRVAGRLETIPQLLGETRATAILIVQDDQDPALLREVVRRCENFPVRLLMADPTAASAEDLRTVRLVDLVARRPVALHAPPERGPFKGEKLLITNADTSLGAEFTWQAARGFPAALILQGESEDALARLSLRLKNEYPGLPVEQVLAAIGDPESFDAAIRPIMPTALVHCFPLHRVESAETNPHLGVSRLVLEAATLADLARDLQFRRTIFLSSVKGVYPVGVLGACQRLTEQIALRLGRDIEHSVQVVRFPTLVGNGFSALEVFESQMKRGNPLTVSHPDASRLYIGLEEAVDRALQALSAHGGNGRLFLIDAGEPVRITDLAKAAAVLGGKRPGKDLIITYTGLKPGEKLREEIAMQGEDLLPTEVSGVLMVQPKDVPDAIRLSDGLAQLADLIPHGSREELLTALRELVPGFHPRELPEKTDIETLLEEPALVGTSAVANYPAGTADDVTPQEWDSQESDVFPTDFFAEEAASPESEPLLTAKTEDADLLDGSVEISADSPENEVPALDEETEDDGRPLRITRPSIVFVGFEDDPLDEESSPAEEKVDHEQSEDLLDELDESLPEEVIEKVDVLESEAAESLTPAPVQTEERAPGDSDLFSEAFDEEPSLFADWQEDEEEVLDGEVPAENKSTDSVALEPLDEVEVFEDALEPESIPPVKDDPMNEQFAELKSRGKIEATDLGPLPSNAEIVLLVFLTGLDVKRQREVLAHAEDRFPTDVHFLFADLLPDAQIPASLAERSRGLDPGIPSGAALWNAALAASPDDALLISAPARVEFHNGFFKTLREFVAEHPDSVLFYADHIDRKGDKDTTVKVHDHNGCPHERFEFGPVLIYRTSALKAIDGFDDSLIHAWEYDAHLKLMMEGFFTRVPGPVYTANEEVVDTKSSSLHSPGRGPLGGFSYVFYPEDMDREVTKVFERALRKVGAFLDHETVPVPQPLQQPEVMASVVVPVLNRVTFIGNAIDKVISGTFQDFEIIIIDNGSTDGTVELVEEYTRKDSRVHLLKGTGSSIASALNDGIRAARGKYICQLDSDDQYAETTLERMIGHLESHPKCGLAISYYRLMNEHAVVIDDVAPITHSGYSRNQILRRDGAGAVRIFPKTVLEEFGLYDEEHYGNFGEDYDMVLKTGEKYDVDRVHDVLYFYRRHSDNTDVIRDPEMKYHNKNRARQTALRRRMKINEDLGKL